jgi:hypothetical protein
MYKKADFKKSAFLVSASEANMRNDYLRSVSTYAAIALAQACKTAALLHRTSMIQKN